MPKSEPRPLHKQHEALVKACRHLSETFKRTVYGPVQKTLQTLPKALSDFRELSQSLEPWLAKRRENAVKNEDAAILIPGIDGAKYSAFRTALLSWRKFRAAQLEEPRALTIDREVVTRLDDEISDIDWLLDSDALNVEAAPIPRLTDYMSVNQAARCLGLEGGPPVAKPDQKFGILLSPDQVASDFEHFRAECELRQLPLSLAFVDIDDFKTYNTRYGHTVVDIDVLPQFQLAIEAHVYQRGRAYREGGDEYILILPNMSKAQAEVYLDELRTRLGQIRYRLTKMEKNPTVSIGVATISPVSIETTREVREAANSALQSAKDAGKDTVRLVSKP